MQKIGIIGFGKFGQTLFKLLGNDFEVHVYEKNKSVYHNISAGVLRRIKIADTPREIYKEVQTVFYCIPISGFEKTLLDHQRFFDNHLLIDTLSVKMHSLRIFRKSLNRKTFSRAILTHPLFTPEDAANGAKGLSIVMYNYSAESSEYDLWKKTFKNIGLKIIELDPKKHDRLISQSYGIAQFAARLLNEINFEQTTVDTPSTTELLKVKNDLCFNTLDSFLDQQKYNAFTKDARLSLTSAFEKISSRLSSESIGYGIQGGKGSFNEEAAKFYLSKNPQKIKYLYTTENVLRSLNRGDINYGQFALDNTLDDVLDESLLAMSKYKFEIVDKLNWQAKHFLMKKRGVEYKDIDTIMSHPQILKQCAQTLKNNYPKLKLISGPKDMIDVAKAAKALASGRIKSTTAILGSKNLAELYDLEIIAENLQDDDESYTTFLIVKRRI